MEYYPHNANSFRDYQIKCLQKELRVLTRRYEYVVRSLAKRVIPEEEWAEWIAEYMGDMED